jgi:hypothetical protein
MLMLTSPYKLKLLSILKVSIALYLIGHFTPLDPKIISQIFYIGIIIPTLFLVKLDDIKALWQSPITKVLLLYLIYVSIAWAVADKVKYFRYAIYILIFTISVWVLVKEDAVDLRSAATFFFCVCLLGIFSGFTYLYITHGHLPPRAWLIGWMTENPIHLSSILATACVVYVTVFCKKGMFIFALLGLLLSLYLISIFEARTAYVALFAAFSVFFMFKFSDVRKKDMKKIVIFLIFFLLLLVFLYGFGGLDFIFLRGSSYRLNIWSILLEQFKSCNYFFGCGYDYDVGQHYFTNSARIVNPHSIYVSEFFYSGVLGLILLMSVIATTLSFGLKHNLLWVYAFAAGCGAFAVDGYIALRPPRNEAWLIFWLPLIMVNVELIKTKFKKVESS